MMADTGSAQAEDVLFHIKGEDVVITKQDNEFVTFMKGVPTMLGLRTQETNKFKKYFALVQSAAGQEGCVFYLDAGDGRDFVTDTLEGEDLMGWLIPKDKVPDFEKEWNSEDISDDWSDFYKWAIWSHPDNPTIKFE